jgi:hypothetical protein
LFGKSRSELQKEEGGNVVADPDQVKKYPHKRRSNAGVDGLFSRSVDAKTKIWIR